MRKSLFGIPVFVAALVVTGSVAGAGPPAIATGTWNCTQASASIESSRTADGNTIISYSATGCLYAGDLTGTFSLSGTRTVRSDGSFADHSRIVCTGCTIGGRTGDFTAVQAFRGTSSGEVVGTITVVSATGGLTGLHAVNHFVSTGDNVGTYSYRYSFEP